MTKIAKAVSRPHQWELQGIYNHFERRAVILMGGWENVRGTTPDDLAQVALYSFTQLTDEYGHDGARKLASRGLQQDLTNLYAREDRETYVEEWEAGPMSDGDDLEWQWEDESHDLVPRYFHPDTVDRLSEVLTPRELEAVLLRYESDYTVEGTAQAMEISSETVKTLLKRGSRKLREVLSPGS